LFPRLLNPVVGVVGLALMLTLLSGAVHAQTPGEPVAYSEEEAQSIDRMLLCPVCPAETIDQAQVPIARQMKAVVRQMLADGATRQEVLDFFADPSRYGPQVLAAPPKSGVNLLAWLLPVVGVAAALAGGFLVIRAMAGRGPEPATGPLIDEELAPYLEAVDRDLRLEDSRDSQQEDGR
jgi:cytochrome c-type biogenesis protein CcmH